MRGLPLPYPRSSPGCCQLSPRFVPTARCSSPHFTGSGGGAQLGHTGRVAAETGAVLPVGCSGDKSCRHPTKNTYQQFVRLFKRDLSPITEKPARFKALPTFSLLPSISSNFLPGQMLQLQTHLATAVGQRGIPKPTPLKPLRGFPNPRKKKSLESFTPRTYKAGLKHGPIRSKVTSLALLLDTSPAGTSTKTGAKAQDMGNPSDSRENTTSRRRQKVTRDRSPHKRKTFAVAALQQRADIYPGSSFHPGPLTSSKEHRDPCSHCRKATPSRVKHGNCRAAHMSSGQDFQNTFFHCICKENRDVADNYLPGR